MEVFETFLEVGILNGRLGRLSVNPLLTTTKSHQDICDKAKFASGPKHY